MKLLIEKIVSGGLGLGRDEAGAVLVPFVAAGEQVRVELVPGGKGRRARLVEVITPSAHRVVPPCPHYGRCGGCHLMHLSYDEQLRAKREILIDALVRIGGITPPEPKVIPAPAALHYRSRVRLHVRWGAAGFFGQRQSEFVPVSRCLLAAETLNAALIALPPFLKRERPDEVELIAAEDGVLIRISDLHQFLWKGAGFEQVRRPVAFSQVNPAQNEALRAEVAALVDEAGPTTVIELYAGSGNLTRVIAREGREITALDADPAAAELGRRELAGAPGRVRFWCLPAAESFREERRADLVLLDPPRSGAREVVPGILAARPDRIVYVSCDPATLARDLKDLTAGGYRLDRLALLDMFPQTAHLETVALLK